MKSYNASRKSFPNLCKVPTYTVLFPVACFAGKVVIIKLTVPDSSSEQSKHLLEGKQNKHLLEGKPSPAATEASNPSLICVHIMYYILLWCNIIYII